MSKESKELQELKDKLKHLTEMNLELIATRGKHGGDTGYYIKMGEVEVNSRTSLKQAEQTINRLMDKHKEYLAFHRESKSKGISYA